MVYVGDIGNIEIHHVLDFLSVMLNKGVACSTINCVKCEVATILHIPTYPSINKHPQIMKYITGIFKFTKSKTK